LLTAWLDILVPLVEIPDFVVGLVELGLLVGGLLVKLGIVGLVVLVGRALHVPRLHVQLHEVLTSELRVHGRLVSQLL